MALIISIETATKVCSVALHADGQLVATQSLHVEKSHAESLLGSVEHLLTVTHYTAKDLSAVALSSGPGSYTGLRIGTSTAKGFCYALDIPLIAINTLEAMAHGLQPYNTSQALLCPMIDARRMEVYCLVIDAQNNVVVPSYPEIIGKNSFQPWLSESPMLFFGDGAEKCKPLLAKHSNALFIDGIYPAASHIGTLAHTKFEQGTFEDLANFTPCYLKPFQGKRVENQ